MVERCFKSAARDLVGLAEALERHLVLDALGEVLQLLLAQAQLAGKRRADWAGADGVDADAARRQLGTERPAVRPFFPVDPLEAVRATK